MSSFKIKTSEYNIANLTDLAASITPFLKKQLTIVNTTIQGIWETTQNITLTFSKVGGNVNMALPSVIQDQINSGSLTLGPFDLSINNGIFLPSSTYTGQNGTNQLNFPIILVNGTGGMGNLLSTGTLTFDTSTPSASFMTITTIGAGFGGSGAGGFNNNNLSWFTN